MPIYGITFLIADRVGQPSRFVLDGLAMAFFQEYGGQPWHWDEPLLWYVRNDMDSWIELSRLAMNMDFFNSEYARAEAGAFIRYLVDVYGVEKFCRFIKGLTPESRLTRKTESVYGKSLEELEQELKVWVISTELKRTPPPMVRVFDTETLQFSLQAAVFDPESVSAARLAEDAEDMAGLISAVRRDLGLSGPKVQWHIVADRTHEFLSQGNPDLEVDEAGNVWTRYTYSPQVAVLAAVKSSGPAAEVLRWGVALHWSEPRPDSRAWQQLTLKEWGARLAKEELLIPLEKLFADFPGGAGVLRQPARRSIESKGDGQLPPPIGFLAFFPPPGTIEG